MTEQELGIDGLGPATEIGRGAFGVVYRAEQRTMGRDVAVKVMPALDDAAAARFDQECRASGAVADHPHIVNVYGAGATADGRRYLLMQHLAGGSLGARIQADGPLEWPEAVELGVKLAGALETAHRAGILHRDVKPGNVLLSAQGEPALCDFGIARVRDGATTTTGSVTATVEHAAPEVLTGGKSGLTSDVYSLASTVFMVITGSPPFTRNGDESVAPMMMRIVNEPVPDLRSQGLPEQVASVLERAMAKDPAQRFASAEEFGEQLRAAQVALHLAPTPMVVHGDVAGRAQMDPGGTAVDDEGLTRHRMRPVAAAVAPVANETPAAKRRPLVIAAAAIALVVALIAGFVVTRPSEPKDEQASGKVVAPESVTLDLGLIKARTSTLQIRRVWTLAGKNGSEFSSVVTLMNAVDAPAPVAIHDEVIPKEIADSAVDIDSQPAFSEAVEADPVVRYPIDLAPGASFEFKLHVDVDEEGVSEKRLRRFQRAQTLAQNLYDKVPEDAPVEVLEEGGVTVVGGSGGGEVASGRPPSSSSSSSSSGGSEPSGGTAGATNAGAPSGDDSASASDPDPTPSATPTSPQADDPSPTPTTTSQPATTPTTTTQTTTTPTTATPGGGTPPPTPPPPPTTSTTTNPAPTAQDDRLPETGSYAIGSTRVCRRFTSGQAGNPRLNDSDPDNDPLTFAIVSREISSGGAGSTLTAFGNNMDGTYVTMESGARLDFCLDPALFQGAHASTPTRFLKIVYRVTDSDGASDTATIYIWMSNG